MVHRQEGPASPTKRPFSPGELQTFFDFADDEVERILRSGRHGALAAYRDAVAFKTMYAWGLRRRESAGQVAAERHWLRSCSMTHLVLQACLNGARARDEHASVPLDAPAIAIATASVASLVQSIHVHAKDSLGADSVVPADVAAAVSAARRAAPELEVGVTTGAWAEPDVETRVAAISDWTMLPDVASVNWHEDGADAVAEALLEAGVGVEAGVWHQEGLAAWTRSPHRDRVRRVLVEVQPMAADAAVAEAAVLVTGVRAVSTCEILLHGEDASAWTVLREAARMGLATRMGFEDVLTLPSGEAASSNRELLESAADVLARARRARPTHDLG